MNMKNAVKLLILWPLIFSLLSCGGAPSVPPSSAFLQVKFLKDITVNGPIYLTVDQDEQLYVIQEDGFIKVMDKEGKNAVSFETQDKAGKPLVGKAAGIAVYQDNIYVTDSDLHRVSIFGRDGRFRESFGRKGGDPKEFNKPMGVCVYRGVVYVADSGNSRIQVFSSDGIYLQTITGFDEKLKEQPKGHMLDEPVDVAVGLNGRIYVADVGSNQLNIYNLDGSYADRLLNVGRPVSVVTDHNGYFMVDQSGVNVRKYNFDNKLLYSFGSKGKGRAQFGSIDGLAVDGEGKIYVADRRGKSLQTFMPEDAVSVLMPDRMSPPTSVRWLRDVSREVSDIAVGPDGAIYGVDLDNKAVLRIVDGKVEKTITIQDGQPVAVAVDHKGYLWMVDKRQRKVFKMDRDGKVLMSFGSSGSRPGSFSKPTDIAVSDAGFIYVADRGNEWIQVFNGDGVFLSSITKGKGQIPLADPISISLDQNNILYVLDRDSMSVMSFSANGKALNVFGRKGKNVADFSKPVSLFAAAGEVFVLDAGTRSIKVFSGEGVFLRQFGAGGSGRGDLDDPADLCAIDEVSFLISDPGNKRLQVLTNIYSPTAPDEVSAIGGMRNVELTWKNNVEPYLESYQVWRAIKEAGPYSVVANVAENTFNDPNVKPGETYYYRIAAVAKEGNEGPKSKVVSAVPKTLKPSMPSGLVAEAAEWSVRLSWEKSKDDFVTHYRIYMKDGESRTEIGHTPETFFVSYSLASDAAYEYFVTAVSTDDVESEAAYAKVVTKRSTKPPLETDVIEMQDVFSNTYKIYETDRMGRIKVTNNTGLPITDIKISFTVKEFMDFPSELVIKELAPGSVELDLKAVFNNNILRVTEDTPVQTEIRALYYDNNLPVEFSKNFTVNIYEKHRMMWDVRQRFATFISPKDPMILEFVRSIVTQYGEAAEIMQQAAVIFDALGVMGVTYMQDPSNPYQITSGNTDFVDYIQYPRETLQRRSGDCDDLVALYAASLESLGIRTKVLEVPGHMLMMFSTGIKSAPDGDTLEGLYVIHEGELWVPVETTLVGSSFVKAWEKGSVTYYEWVTIGQLSMFEIREAWGKYKPASLPHSAWRPPSITRDKIEEKFHEEFSTLKKISLRFKNRNFFNILKKDPDNVEVRIYLGIVYAKANELAEAAKLFKKVLDIDRENVGAFNNLGNIRFMEGNYKEARVSYEKAAELDPADPLVTVNLARCYQRLDLIDKAKATFKKGYELDPAIAKEYRALALELLGSL
ncbi:MAG: tetratricopeptide repeat protein [Proteobacteria bacterium]|nr:tetratricopeptide repeat protein [Pseudomonadota bacterium]MBU1714244.1 tetratricopeptide repeat protein [Pseudomonadota bacterium]